jgi:hypothetical protein
MHALICSDSEVDAEVCVKVALCMHTE